MDLNHRPHPYQLKSDRRLMKIREVNEGARRWMSPAGRGPVVVNWCCQLYRDLLVEADDNAANAPPLLAAGSGGPAASTAKGHRVRSTPGRMRLAGLFLPQAVGNQRRERLARQVSLPMQNDLSDMHSLP